MLPKLFHPQDNLFKRDLLPVCMRKNTCIQTGIYAYTTGSYYVIDNMVEFA
jgi:hypothetical protein